MAPYLGVARSLTGRGWWRERIAGLGVSDHALRELTQKLALMDVAEADVVEPLGRFIAGRGITAAGLEDFIRPTLKGALPRPAIVHGYGQGGRRDDRCAAGAGQYLDLRRLRRSMSATSAAQLVRWFRAMDLDLNVYVPDRVTEGYGPSNAAFDRLKEMGADLVITVDCGAMAHKALDHAGFDRPGGRGHRPPPDA